MCDLIFCCLNRQSLKDTSYFFLVFINSAAKKNQVNGENIDHRQNRSMNENT